LAKFALLYVCCEDFADIFWNKSSNEVCSEVIQAKLVLAADMPMVLTDEIVEPPIYKIRITKSVKEDLIILAILVVQL
jgi:hypothetical protein